MSERIKRLTRVSLSPLDAGHHVSDVLELGDGFLPTYEEGTGSVPFSARWKRVSGRLFERSRIVVFGR